VRLYIAHDLYGRAVPLEPKDRQRRLAQAQLSVAALVGFQDQPTLAFAAEEGDNIFEGDVENEVLRSLDVAP
jgi:hypothetical protein